MSSQNITYERVARKCSAYSPSGCDHSIKNVSTGSDAKECSCLNCSHFDSSQHCVLDLYDRIVDQI